MSHCTPSSEGPQSDIVPARPEHLDSLVSCHILALPQEPITILGRGFLRAHYAYYIAHPEGVCLIGMDEQSGQVTGFVVGGRPELRKRFVLKNVVRFVVTVFVKALVSPTVRRRLAAGLSGLLPGSHRGASAPEEPRGTYARLLFIGVHPDYRRRGVASRLLGTFHTQCAAQGFQTMRLMTENINAPGIAMYEKAGWQIVHRSETDTYFRRDARSDN